MKGSFSQAPLCEYNAVCVCVSKLHAVPFFSLSTLVYVLCEFYSGLFKKMQFFATVLGFSHDRSWLMGCAFFLSFFSPNDVRNRSAPLSRCVEQKASSINYRTDESVKLVFMYSRCIYELEAASVCVSVCVCVWIQMGRVVLFKHPLPAMVTCNKWVGARKWQPWQLTGEGGNSEGGEGEKRWRCVCVCVCQGTRKDKAKGKRDGKSLRADKEQERMRGRQWRGRGRGDSGTIPPPDATCSSYPD